jgi:hypothetical protein
VLTLGVAASVAANVLHAHSNLISQLIAAWPPLALLLTVELISRVPADRRALAAARLMAAGTIAGIAGWVSYWHMVGVAVRYGETGAAAAYLLPVSVDGLVVVASISLLEIAGRIGRPSQLPLPGGATAPHSSIGDDRRRPVGAPAAPVRPQAIAPGNAGQPVHADAVTSADSGVRGNAAVTEAANRIEPIHAQQLLQRQEDYDGDRARRDHTDAGDGASAARDGAQAAEPSAAGDVSPAVPAGDGGPIGHHEFSADCTSATASGPSTTSDLDNRERALSPTGDEQDHAPPVIDTANSGGADSDATGDREYAADADNATMPSGTAAAVAYWYRRDPDLHPADIAARIGRSERTVRRYWPPTPPAAVNGHDAHGLAEQLRR